MSVEVVQRNVGHHLEGPHWDHATGTLLYVDIPGKTVYRYNPRTGKAMSVNIGERVGAVVPTRSGRTLVAAGHIIGYIDWETGKVETLVEVEKDRSDTRFNDAKCDPAGRFWAGTMGFEDSPTGPDERGTPDRGALYCLHPDNTLVTHIQNVGISNGLAWTADKKTMYYIDSFKYGVDAFDYDIESGNISNRRQVISLPGPERFPDGMCIDSEDMLWVAYFNGGAVRRYNPKSGEMLREIKLPADVITQDAAGSILRVTGLGVKGVKGETFNDLL